MKILNFKQIAFIFIFGIFLILNINFIFSDTTNNYYSGSTNSYLGSTGSYSGGSGYNYQNYNYGGSGYSGVNGYSNSYNNYGGSYNNYEGNYLGSTGSYNGGLGTYSGNSGSYSGGLGTYNGRTGTYGGTTNAFSGGTNGYSNSGYDSGFSGINVQYTDPNNGGSYAYTNPSQYWSNYNTNNCNYRQDVLMQIMPFGCSPAVVRSDLLEEQNVPVFCKVMSFQANPLIDISRVRSISFSGSYPKGISGVSYYPSRAALVGNNYGLRNIENSPINTEMGYLVVVLTRQPIEANMSDYVEGNITASIDYDSEGAYGIGQSNYYLSELSDVDWNSNYKQYGFWNGKGYIRAESINSNQATFGIYTSPDTRVSGVTLRRGETSKDIYLPGFYCAAGLNVRLENIGAPIESALIQVNDKQLWISKGDKILDNKCSVVDLKTNIAGGGKVTLNCPGKSGKIELYLTPGKASLISSSGNNNYAVGEKISSEENVYLAYIGSDVDSRKFAVLVKDGFSDTTNEFSDKDIYNVVDKIESNTNKNIFDLKPVIKSAIENQYIKKLSNIKKEEISSKVEVYVISENEEAFGFKLDSVSVATDTNVITSDSTNNQKLSFEYYNKAVKTYEDLVDLYPSEKRIEGEDSYAAIGLYEAGKLSKDFDMNAKATNYFSTLIKKYPDSSVAKMVSSEGNVMKFDTSKSKSTISINNQQYIIDLLDFKKPTRSDLSATLLVEGKEVSIGLNEIYSINRDNDTLNIQLTELSNGYAVLKLNKVISKGRTTTRTERLSNNNGQIVFENTNIKLLNIHLSEQAKVILMPKSFGTRAQSNFSFKIGIEKRAIKLSTEQSKEMLESLLKSIAQWKDINNKLSNVVRVMKGACFATSAILTAKTYLNGINGDSIARNSIMTNKGGWNDVCEKLISEKKYSTLQQCLLDKSGDIDKDVKIYADQIKKTNDVLKNIENSVGKTRTDPLDSSGQVDSKKVEEEFKKQFDDMCKGATGDVILPDKDKTKISIAGANGVCGMGNMSQEQRRNIYTLYNARNSGGSSVLNGVIDNELGKTVLDAKNLEDANRAQNLADKNSKDFNINLKSIVPSGDSVTMGDVKRITKSDTSNPVYKNFKEGTYVIRVFVPQKKSFGNNLYEADSSVAGKEVIIEVTEVKGAKGTYLVGNKMYTIDGTEITGPAGVSVKDYLSLAGINRIKQTDTKSYHNSMVDVSNLMVKYFDSSPYKGLPAEIPFDVNEGWYVELTYILSGFGKPYDESGRPINFYICNVGENGKMEFKQSGDDICRYYNAETGADINFPGMSVSESRNLVSKALSAITEAAKQYGKDRITINGHVFKSGTSFGGQDGQCSDFMSPTDCNVLFNVCDPVICPSSRCDLGGQYRVDNVIQSGIVGSLTLCLPNMREGIAVPICLSGVNAGLESYISILNSTAQCLNESITTGQNIGICDEIKSIYLCDFFWKQATPFLSLIIPKMVEGLYGQGTRGGGEYLTVQESWKNTQNAINYFTNQYAINSMKAFSSRNTETITTTDICKSFTSLSIGSGVSSLFENLIEPDSPVQFSAWFSEDVLTTATVPTTSHYKVYYHIYAGKDMGSYYSVYLKNPAQVSGINSIGYYTVATGFIPRGGQVDQAKDFTGPGGFKQLCVNVNGKEECGFGSVSTSYLLNSLTDSYVASQANDTKITSEKTCVSGTPSAYSLINPNLQAGIENSMNGQLYNQGIIRVCASQNPGKKVLGTGEYDVTNSTYDRWKDVGYCDDATIRCWLDTNSVSTNINNKYLLNQTLTQVSLAQLGANEFWTADESMSVANGAKNYMDGLLVTPDDTKDIVNSKIQTVESDLIKLTKLGNNNLYRARGMYLLANLYRRVALGLLKITTIVDSGYGDSVSGDEYTVSSTYSSVSQADIQNDDLGEYIQVYENNQLNKYYITNFNLQTQSVTLLDDSSIKRIGKDSSGRIVFLSSSNSVNNNGNLDNTNTGNEEIVGTDNTNIGGDGTSPVWRDDILREGVLIKVNYVTGSKFYQYSSSNGWFSDDSEFISKNSGSNMNYVDGVNYLVKKTNFLGNIVIENTVINNNLFDSDEKLSDKVFNVLLKSG